MIQDRWPVLSALCVMLAVRSASAQDLRPPLSTADPPLTSPAPAPSSPALPSPAATGPAASAPPPASAAPPVQPPSPREPGRESARTLKGHALPTPFLIDSAFVQSGVGLGVELGHQWEPGVVSSAPSGALDFQYDRSIGVATQYLSFGLAVTDRVELGFSASYSSFLGGDVNTSILYGGKNAWNIRPGIRTQLLRVPATGTQLGLHLYGDFGSSAWRNPAGILAEIAAEVSDISRDSTGMRALCLAAGELSCALANANFNANTATTTTRSQFGAGITLGLAQVIGSNFALQAAVGLDAAYAATDAMGTSFASGPVAFHAGVAPSPAFGANVPIELMVEYLFTALVEPTVNAGPGLMGLTPDVGTTLTLQSDLAGGFYYTGRPDLSLGALVTATFSEATLTDDSGNTAKQALMRITGQVTARYFF